MDRKDTAIYPIRATTLLKMFMEGSKEVEEVLASVESSPDAIMPMTKGPMKNDWDRWFQGGHSSRNRKRWI